MAISKHKPYVRKPHAHGDYVALRAEYDRLLKAYEELGDVLNVVNNALDMAQDAANKNWTEVERLQAKLAAVGAMPMAQPDDPPR